MERVQALKGRLYRTARLYLAGDAAALDAVDEAVYKGLLSCRRLRRTEYFDTWMTRILINVCNDELRRLKRERTSACPRSCGRWWPCGILPVTPWRRRRRS